MKKYNYLIIGLFLSTLAISNSQAQERTCNCQLAFDDMITKLEDNYIGLKLNNSGNSIKEYEKRKLATRNFSAKTKAEDCTGVLQQFLSQLNDGHLFVFEQPDYSANELAKYRGIIQATKIDLNRIDGKDFAEDLNSITGKWTDGISEIVVIKEGKLFNAYILHTTDSNMSPGEIKASFKQSKEGFTGVLYSYHYAPKYIQGGLFRESTLLNLGGGVIWRKLNANKPSGNEMINQENVAFPVIRKIDEKNVLFSIPSFLINAEKFNTLLTNNIDILSNAENLIFDIRGNTGGDALYMAFIDAYADRPLPASQGLILASAETEKYFEQQAKYAPQIFQPVVDSIKKNMGKIVDGPAYPEKIFKPFPTKIKNVAILTDEGCMSAAESFILHSKAASSKVKTFGRATAGVIDYTSVNVLRLNSGNQKIYFGYPTSTLTKKIPADGYNKTGIIPDVKIPDKVQDKIKFIIDYYDQNNK